MVWSMGSVTGPSLTMGRTGMRDAQVRAQVDVLNGDHGDIEVRRSRSAKRAGGWP